MIAAIEQFHFLRPALLLVLLPAIPLAVLLWRSRGRADAWSRVISSELLPHLLDDSATKQRSIGIPLLLAAWCLAAIAAAGPSWKQLPTPVLQKQDALVLLVDQSYSMLAADLQPSRADRARRKLLDLLQERREGLTALIAYAGDAHVVAPLTDDNPTIANLLPALGPQMMPLPGSDPVDAIERAIALLDSAGVRKGRLLLVTDGISEQDVVDIEDRLQNRPLRLLVMGVGTEVGAPIGLPDGGFLKDASGEIVVPALDQQPLQALARATGGRYQQIAVGDGDLDALLAEDLLLNDEDTISLDRQADQWEDMAHWFVLPLLVLALLSFRRGLVLILPLALCLDPNNAVALEWADLWLTKDQQGQRNLNAGDAASAATLFQDPSWKGTAAFEAEDYQGASEAFATDPTADGLYNLGNSLAAEGKYDEAIDAYKQSLDLQPNSADALANIETLEQLKEQQEQQEQQNQQQNPNQDPSNSEQDGEQGESSDNPESGRNDQSSQENGENQPQEQQEPRAPEQQSGNSSSQDQDGSDPQQSELPQDGKLADEAGEDEAREAPSQPTPQIDNSAMQEDLERDQAMQQWLRRVPDDPSGLLREKFRYESRKRQQQGKKRASNQIW
ncbi:MAG: VWA domain-containing protein [Pseudomonadota bacterium]